MKNKILSLLLTVCITVTILPISVTANAEKTASPIAAHCAIYHIGSNDERQDYGKKTYCSDTVKSYLHPLNDGSIMRIQAGGDIKGFVFECYDSEYNIQLDKSGNIDEELPIFGGFYATDNAYFILTGQTNIEENNETEVFRITKYSKTWERIGSAGLYGANTVEPFDAGSARMEAYGDYLLVRTCHKMYKTSDGLNHQANVTIQLNMNTMEITDSLTSVSNVYQGYVSHSFNQFIRIEDGHIVAVDHGDAIPRSIAMIKYPTDVTSGTFLSYNCRLTNAVKLKNTNGINYNYTGASIGAFEISDKAYLIAGNSVQCDEEYITRIMSTHNVFVTAVDKETNEITQNWLTEYEEGDITASTPHMVKVNENLYTVLWSRENRVYYTTVDSRGQSNGIIYSMKGSLSDCSPVVANGKITWYVWNNGRITFYRIETEDLSVNSSTVINNEHNYTVVPEENGVVKLRCQNCGEEKRVGVYTSFRVWWNTNGGSLYSSMYNTNYDIGERLYIQLEGNEHSDDIELNSEWTIEISDEQLVSYKSTYYDTRCEYGYFTMLGTGNVTLTLYPKYNPDIKEVIRFEINEVGHHYEYVNEDGIDDNGVIIMKCPVCGRSKCVGTCTSYKVWWNTDGGYTYYSTYPQTCYVGDKLYTWLRGENYSSGVTEINKEWSFYTSNGQCLFYKSWSSSSSQGEFGYLKLISPGTVTVTFYPRYNPNLKKDFTIIIEAKKGDVTLDGTITTDDAILIQDYLTGKEILTTDQLSAADTNDDGEVNLLDAYNTWVLANN